jgi:hypothetical protein
VAAFVDAEHALDPLYASRIGVKIDDLLISQPDTGEQALEIVEVLVRSGAVDVIVIDSVAALVPKAEIEGEMGDAHVGLQARLMSQALRKLTAAISKSNCSVIFLNQLREKVGIMFGNPETQPGGRALKFYSSVRLDIRKVEVIKSGLRHPLQRRHLARGLAHRRRARVQHPREERHLDVIRRPTPRPGPRERAQLPAGEPNAFVGDRGCSSPQGRGRDRPVGAASVGRASNVGQLRCLRGVLAATDSRRPTVRSMPACGCWGAALTRASSCC